MYNWWYDVHFINTWLYSPEYSAAKNPQSYALSCMSPRPVGGGGRSHHNCIGPASGIQIEVLKDTPPHY